MRGWRGRDVESIGPVHERRAQRDGGGVLDAQVKVCGVRENAVAAGGVGDGVADDLADFDGAGLLEKEHRDGLGRLCRFGRCSGEDHCWRELDGGVLCLGWWFRGYFE